MKQLTIGEWNDFLSECPDAHLLQTGQWGELKSNFGWEPARIISQDGSITWGTQILFRQRQLGFTFA